MKTAMVIVQILVRLSGLFIIVLGVAVWTGRALTLIPIHEQLAYVSVGFAVGAGCPGCSRRCRSRPRRRHGPVGVGHPDHRRETRPVVSGECPLDHQGRASAHRRGRRRLGRAVGC